MQYEQLVDKSDRCQRPPNELVSHPARFTPSNHCMHTTPAPLRRGAGAGHEGVLSWLRHQRRHHGRLPLR